MNSKLLTSAAFLLLATNCPKVTAMSWWDEVDETVRREVEKVKPMLRQFEWAASPLRSITENRDTKQLEFELNFAGYDKDEIKVSINDGVLKITAERKKNEEKTEESTPGNKTFIFQMKDHSQKSFSHDLKRYSVDLSKPGAIETTYKNGILKIAIPLKKEFKSELKLEIKSEDEPTK